MQCHGIRYGVWRAFELLVGIGLFAASVPPAYAATIYVTPERLMVNKGDTFVADVRLDPEEACINVVSVDVHFDPNLLQAVDLSRGESIITLWLENQVTVDQDRGVIHFAGGIPGGYCGRVQGDPGKTNNLAKLVFTTLPFARATTTVISIGEKSEAHLNDDRGTIAPLERANARVIISDTGAPVKNEWLELVNADTIAPEFFQVHLYQREGKNGTGLYLVFNTTDKQSGISHYEVLETDPERYGYDVKTGKPARWERATSPYFLRDQSLSSRVFVKAVDKAGNERIAEAAIGRPYRYRRYLSTIIAAIVVLGVGVGVWYYYRRRGRSVL